MFAFLWPYTCTTRPADISYASLCTSCDSLRVWMFEFGFRSGKWRQRNTTELRHAANSATHVSSVCGRKSSYLSSTPEAEPVSVHTSCPWKTCIKYENRLNLKTERSYTWQKWTPGTIVKVYHTQTHKMRWNWFCTVQTKLGLWITISFPGTQCSSFITMRKNLQQIHQSFLSIKQNLPIPFTFYLST